MSEAKLTDIHFLVVLVFCKHPQGLEAHIENEVFKYAFPARFGCSANTPHYIPRTTKRLELHLGKLAFLWVYPSRFWLFSKHPSLPPPLHIPEQPRGLHTRKYASIFKRVYPDRFWLFLKHPYYTFYPLNPLSKEQWKIIICMR